MSDRKYKFLTAQVDVPTGKKAERAGDPLPTKRVGPGLLSELDITDEQASKLPRQLVRSATADEIQAADNAAAARKARDVAATAQLDASDAEIERRTERANVEAELNRERDARLAEIDKKHEAERAETAERTADQLNEANAAGSGARRLRNAPVNTQGGDRGTTAGGGTPTQSGPPGNPGAASPSPAVSPTPSTPTPPTPPKK
jgi:hypothetical protein